MSSDPVDVFLSSTCHDLLDLRAELRKYLEENGCIVRMSDDVDSSFAVHATKDSIESCLLNVDKSDVVVCVLDRRYGPPLPGSYSPYSATETEVRRARGAGKPIIYFIRDLAFKDFEQLKNNPTYDARWVEPKHRGEWLRFVKEVTDLPSAASGSRSNWFDQFSTITDLKAKLLKRLHGYFASSIVAVAMRPERLVRLYCEIEYHEKLGELYRFRNAGTGPAVNVRIGFLISHQEIMGKSIKQGALLEGDLGPSKASHPRGLVYSGANMPADAVFCDYQNRFGDWYRVLVPTSWQNPGTGIQVTAKLNDEAFFVGRQEEGSVQWDQVYPTKGR